MSKLKQKLRARRGETLAEVLVSLLILGLSTLMLASMLNTAGQLGVQAQKRDAEFLEALNSVEGQTTPLTDGGTPPNVEIYEGEPGTDTLKDRIPVTLYGNDRLKGYALPPSGGGDAE